MLKKSKVTRVKRTQVYAGEVYSKEFGFIRGMLFIINDKGRVVDLIYDSPNYTLYELQTKEERLEPICIKHAINLEEALKYLNYPIFLESKDINKIYKELVICNKWLKNNLHLFDYHRADALPYYIYENLSWINLDPNGKPTKEELMMITK